MKVWGGAEEPASPLRFLLEDRGEEKHVEDERRDGGGQRTAAMRNQRRENEDMKNRPD